MVKIPILLYDDKDLIGIILNPVTLPLHICMFFNKHCTQSYTEVWETLGKFPAPDISPASTCGYFVITTVTHSLIAQVFHLYAPLTQNVSIQEKYTSALMTLHE